MILSAPSERGSSDCCQPSSVSVLVIWRDHAFAIRENQGNMISFQSEMDVKPGEEIPPLTNGWLDRVTGAFHATYDFGSVSQPLEESYSLICKRTNPVF